MLKIWSCAVVLASAGTVFAQGADITHQEIQDASTYTPVGGVYGYAWGSYTCNLGNAALSWVNGGTPALAMNAYRLHGGVLRQIGYGFAKHACCVGNGSGCGTCGGGGGGLLPGCRDIYGSGFNGGQTRLGPRSGINPFEGTFAPIASFSGDSIARRVQIPAAQMSATTFANAQYFAEGVYVCAEELPPTQLNNATYRRMNVANTGAAPTYAWTPSTTASQMGRPAIYAWRDHGLGANQPDNSVTVVTADVPNEGRFFAAGKVTQLSPTSWRYDYAVFNLNSHRSGYSLSVPVPVRAAVSGVAFSDIDVHSGEPYSNADWTNNTDAGRVTWASGQTFAQNPNANALRWGTMYNFSYLSDAAPATNPRPLTLGLFRPAAGSPNSIQISGLPTPGIPRCAADFDSRPGVDIDDLLSYLASYEVGEVRADMDDGSGTTSPDGGVGVDDLLEYLDRYNTGC